MAERRMLLNSTEESFIGTMDIIYVAYNIDENTGNYIPINFNCYDNIKIINHDFSNDEGYVTIGFKNELLIPSTFIINNYIFQLFFGNLHTDIPNPIVKFDNESLMLNFYNSEYIDEINFNIPCEFIGDCIYGDTNLRYIKIYDKTIYNYEWVSLTTPNYTIVKIYDVYNVHYARFSYGIKEIHANAHVLYDIMKYNNIKEGDEKAKNYKILNNNRLIISSPTQYITTIPNVDLGTNNYIQSVNNYMYEENYITEYVCARNITHLRKGITLPKDATVYFPDSVTDIDSDTFKYESNLKKVVIFGNCKLTYLNGFDGTTLENIEIYSDKVIDIKAYCFVNSEKLTQFTTPESVLKIGDGAFHNTTLKSLYISKNVNDIYGAILMGSESVESIIVDENNLKYDSRNNYNAIIYNKQLIQGCKNTIIPNDIDTIGSEAFNDMGLKEIIIPDNITRFGNNAFSYNPIDNIIIPESVTYIDTNCFNNTNIYKNENNWVNGILYISNYIVSVKRNISGEITILDSTRLICVNAFYSLSNITKINIPNSLKHINNHAFYGIGDLIIEYDGYEDEWNNIVKGDYWNYNTNITYIFKTDVVEPEPEEPEQPEEEIPTFEGTPPNNQIWYTSTDEEIVEPLALYKNTNLSEQLNIVKNKYYTGLGGVIETDGDIIATEEECFYKKSNLKTIILPDSIIALFTNPFLNCENLISIKIGKNFNGNISGQNTAIALGSPNIETIIIDSENTYCYDNNQTSIIRKQDNCLIQGTKNTIIPNTVKQIGWGAFRTMDLTNITISNNIEYIHDYAFANNKNLTTVVLPDIINLIGEGQFFDCTTLNSINIPINGKFPGISIYNTAIWNNEENWYNNALYWNNALLYIRDTDGYNIYIVKSGTKTICSEILYQNINFNYPIKLPNSVQNILDYAFGFSYITELYYDGTVNEWNAINKSDLWNANSRITVIHCVDNDIQL